MSLTELLPRLRWFASGVAVAVAAWSCTPVTRHAAPPKTPLMVLGAASLASVLTTLEERYEATHPDVDVQISTAGSQTLRMHIEQGLRADVFASANLGHLAALRAAGLTMRAQPFAHNSLVVAVRDGHSLRDVRQLDAVSRLAVGATHVPIGTYTRTFLSRANTEIPGFELRVLSRVVSFEPNVRLTLAKVLLGQADAAIVYGSDIIARRKLAHTGSRSPRRPQLRAVVVPARWQPTITYGVAALTHAAHPLRAARWIAWLRGPDGQQILRDYGFIGAHAGVSTAAPAATVQPRVKP